MERAQHRISVLTSYSSSLYCAVAGDADALLTTRTHPPQGSIATDRSEQRVHAHEQKTDSIALSVYNIVVETLH